MQETPPAKITELTDAQKSRARIPRPEGASRLAGLGFGERRLKGKVTTDLIARAMAHAAAKTPAPSLSTSFRT